MTSRAITLAAACALELAQMPAKTIEQCREQDLAAAAAVELIAAACEGNGDAHPEFMDAVVNLRATVKQDRQRDAENALPDVWPFRNAEEALI